MAAKRTPAPAGKDTPPAKDTAPTADKARRVREAKPRLLGTGEAKRLVADGQLELLDGFERREYRKGRPVYEPLTMQEANRAVGNHHDAMGGRAALEAGAELLCGGHVVRRKRNKPTPAVAQDGPQGGA